MNTSRHRPRSRGQIIIVFALAIIAFVGLCAIVIDVSWYWSNSLRMQRAADAAALAGVVNLPGREDLAILDARAEAQKNGYIDCGCAATNLNAIHVNAAQDPTNLRRLNVTISGPVGTFFARVLGINSFRTSRDSKAEYTLPVPMGSPENYYGVFGLTRGLTSSATVSTPVNTGSTVNVTNMTAATPNSTPVTNWSANTGTITSALAANESDTTAAAKYAQSNTANATLDLGNFGLTTGLAANQSVTGITGLQVLLDDAYLSAACGATTNRFLVQVSYNGGANWSTSTTTTRTGNLGINTAPIDTTIGLLTDMTAWTFSSGHAWDADDFDQNNFKVRLTASKACGTSGTQLRLDQLRVNARYAINTLTFNTSVVTTPITDQNLKGPGTACPLGVSNCYLADGSNLNPRGFWGTMNSQGAPNANGDAFQPFYDTSGGTAAPLCAVAAPGTACYDPDNYYNYAIEMPLGATGGKIYVYDPVFCATSVDKGTGDRWFTAPTTTPVTSIYELYDTNDTLYDRTDDGLPIATSNGLFRNVEASDTTMSGTAAPNDCKHFSDATYGDGRDYHDNWYLLYSGMTGGVNGPKVYRIHTTSTDPANLTAQKTTSAENSFALYASGSGGTPKLYGIGAMQAFTPLKAGTGGSSTTVSSTFYLAQIEKAHAGKTLELTLWDPGDTDPLTASLEILIPTGPGTWAATPVTYRATLGTSNGGRADGTGGKPDCRLLSRTTASNAPISTFDNAATSNTGKFNGCWLTIDAVIPTTYNAVAGQDWWQIRYTMTGDGTSNDVTTWKADIRGNPVHLVLP